MDLTFVCFLSFYHVTRFILFSVLFQIFFFPSCSCIFHYVEVKLHDFLLDFHKNFLVFPSKAKKKKKKQRVHTANSWKFMNECYILGTDPFIFIQSPKFLKLQNFQSTNIQIKGTHPCKFCRNHHQKIQDDFPFSFWYTV